MTVKTKTTEVKESVVEPEVTVMDNKEKFTTKVKAKAEVGKNWVTRNSKKIKTAAIAGLGAVALGAVAMVANDKLGDGTWSLDPDVAPDEESSFDVGADA